MEQSTKVYAPAFHIGKIVEGLITGSTVPEIIEQTGLHPRTVYVYTAQWRKQGLVVKAGVKRSLAGGRAQILKLKGDL